MKRFLKKNWVVPICALVFTLVIGSAAFAATGTSSTSTSTGASGAGASVSAGECDGTQRGNGPHGRGEAGQRRDETPLTGDTLTQAQAAALAEVGADATVMRAEADADGNAAYEVHVRKADGTMVTVYLDESFQVVTVKEAQMGGRRAGKGAGGLGGGERQRDGDCDGTGNPSYGSTPETTGIAS